MRVDGETGLIDILIVTYRPDIELMRRQLDCICSQGSGFGRFNLYIRDNSDDSFAADELTRLVDEFKGCFLSHRVLKGKKNIGFGSGHNRLMQDSSCPWVLILNQEVLMEPGCMESLMSVALSDDEGCAWEARQIPFEHPKIYDPATLESPWVSCAACLFRRSALEAVNGFEPKIFMYGEDVDLSWRLRAGGWRLRYVPRAAVIHHAYACAGEIKPVQAVEGTLTNLCLRARFGTYPDIIRGILMLFAEVVLPESFPGRRRAFAGIFFRFLKMFRYYRRDGRFRQKGFKPVFSGWDYALHREGAFFPFKGRKKESGRPMVSILVRTCNRPGLLREALLSIRHQTYPEIEVVVVEDGPPASEKMVLEEFAPDMNLRYYATGRPVGRSRAGNLALETATGEWLNFLDDDDLLFADHVEVLVRSVLENRAKGAYGLAWETETKWISKDPLKYRELSFYPRHRRNFCRITLRHYNYMPIQSVLFSRRLYERWGGLEEDMEELEDWNLWTRYTIEDDFVYVDRCTSKYRVPPYRSREQVIRQERLDLAYSAALEKQKEMSFAVDPGGFSEPPGSCGDGQAFFLVTHGWIRSLMERHGATRWLMKRRGHFRRLSARVKRRHAEQ